MRSERHEMMANAKNQPLTAWPPGHVRKRQVKAAYTSTMMLQMLAIHRTRANIAAAGRAGLSQLHLALPVLREGLHERLEEPLHLPVPAVNRRRNSASHRTPGGVTPGPFSWGSADQGGPRKTEAGAVFLWERT